MRPVWWALPRAFAGVHGQCRFGACQERSSNSLTDKIICSSTLCGLADRAALCIAGQAAALRPPGAPHLQGGDGAHLLCHCEGAGIAEHGARVAEQGRVPARTGSSVW